MTKEEIIATITRWRASGGQVELEGEKVAIKPPLGGPYSPLYAPLWRERENLREFLRLEQRLRERGRLAQCRQLAWRLYESWSGLMLLMGEVRDFLRDCDPNAEAAGEWYAELCRALRALTDVAHLPLSVEALITAAAAQLWLRPE